MWATKSFFLSSTKANMMTFLSVWSSQVEGGKILYDLEGEHEVLNLYRIGDRSDIKLAFVSLNFYDRNILVLIKVTRSS